MKKIALGLIATAMALTGLTVTFTPAQATTSVSTCSPGWYVNPDETGALAEAATDGSFTAQVATGVAPLFKFETSKPYSTINKTSAGLYWSSKIVSGVGSQADPTTLAKLATLSPYTAETVLVSFGVGYANDTGNTATVTSVTYAKVTYSFVCTPPVTTTTKVSTSSTPTPSKTSSATVTPSSSQSAIVVPPTGTTSFPTVVARPASNTESLASTGASVEPGWLVVGGAALILLGGAALLLVRARRNSRS
jgi:LPXTG-motif cell wall-anchored protein